MKIQLVVDILNFAYVIIFRIYWGDDGEAPQWRIDKKIGKPINS